MNKIYSARVERLATSYQDIESRKATTLLEELIAVAERSKTCEDAVQRALTLSILSGELLRRAELGAAFGKGATN